MIETVHATCLNVLGPKSYFNKKWISAETLQKTKEKREKKSSVTNRTTTEEKQQQKTTSHNIGPSIDV
ncbi:hypothetical protein DPMN_134680 [Dreissena polymorpha]|uniref:Uncharacterized protein n=1 Tax=Dreissena polymorpha TaxID=45954 RepID=A0A9D4JAW8_DREPO|nr:hypothetical protein DPMN_134680 [Dreissena polymorpha]